MGHLLPVVLRFRAVHEEVCKLDHDFGSTFSGVLTDDEGRVRALWGSYSEQVSRSDEVPGGDWRPGVPVGNEEPSSSPQHIF